MEEKEIVVEETTKEVEELEVQTTFNEDGMDFLLLKVKVDIQLVSKVVLLIVNVMYCLIVLVMLVEDSMK